MDCPTCGHANRAGANFCAACGEDLVTRCAQCGNGLDPGSRFCDACGHPAGETDPGGVAAPVPALPEHPSEPATLPDVAATPVVGAAGDAAEDAEAVSWRWRRGWRGLPIAAKLTIAITGVVLIAVGAVTGLSVYSEQSTFRSGLEDQAEILLDELQAELALPLFRGEEDTLQQELVRLVDTTALLSAQIFDRDGRLKTQAADAGVTLPSEPLPLAADFGGETDFSYGDGRLTATRAIPFALEILGLARVELSSEALGSELAAVRNRGIGIALAVSALGLLLTYALSHSITGPLRQLQRAAGRLGRGDLDQQVEVTSDDEVGRLAAEFNRMAGRLRSTINDLDAERARSEQLLLNILPRPIAERLKRRPGVIADEFDEVTVLFCDVVGFTERAAQMDAEELVELLNGVFTECDALVERHGLEKIKTIGDGYMAAAGVPAPRADHAAAAARLAIDMQRTIAHFHANGMTLNSRIGLHTGPVVAGVFGTHKFAYDLWGDTVNTANRMEKFGVAGRIQVSATTHAALRDEFEFDDRGLIDVKGKGAMHTYLLRTEPPERATS